MSEIDAIFYTRKHNLLLVLPFLDNPEALTLADRIRRRLLPRFEAETPPAVITFPDDEADNIG